MADGKIYITISDTRGGSGSGVSNDADSGASSNNESKLGKFVAHKVRNLVESEARTFVNYTIGNHGNFTGDYIAQSEMQGAMNAINFMTELGSAIATGAKMGGGGWGSLIGAAVAVTTFSVIKGVNFGLQERSEKFQQTKTNRNLEIMRERLGMEGLTNGSRSGGY
jgi:hypothetical protein